MQNVGQKCQGRLIILIEKSSFIFFLRGANYHASFLPHFNGQVFLS